MNGVDNTDDLFNRLVAKQTGKELQHAGAQRLDNAVARQLDTLWKTIKQKGVEFDFLDLQNREVQLAPELCIIAGLMQGVALPLLDLDEVSLEPLGGLGVCLLVDSQLLFKGEPRRVKQLYAFHDYSDSMVHFPPHGHEWEGRMQGCPRLASFMHEMFSRALKLCHSVLDEDEGDGHPVHFEWDSVWVGEATTMIDQWVKIAFHDAKLVQSTARLEQIEFELKMRESMGLGNP